jgi:hypothetical protein
MTDDLIPADLPSIVTETLDDPIGDRLRDTRSVGELVNTDQSGESFDVDTEDV